MTQRSRSRTAWTWWYCLAKAVFVEIQQIHSTGFTIKYENMIKSIINSKQPYFSPFMCRYKTNQSCLETANIYRRRRVNSNSNEKVEENNYLKKNLFRHCRHSPTTDGQFKENLWKAFQSQVIVCVLLASFFQSLCLRRATYSFVWNISL